MHYKKIVYDYFNYNRSQRLAIYVMVIVSMIALAVPEFIYRAHADPTLSNDKLDSVKTILGRSGNGYATFNNENDDDNMNMSALFHFDPNVLAKNEWMELGVREDVANRIINYTAKGGKFYKKTDLLKIYGFPENDFERLYPYMVLENRSTDTKQIARPADSLFYFDPNTISKEQWVLLGVKNFIADRIINYRSKGGKYHQKEDLLKTWGFEQKDFDRLQDYIVIDSIQFDMAGVPADHIEQAQKQIVEINAATKEQLMMLGFSAYNANGIIKFRNDLGGLHEINQLYDIYKIDTAAVTRALPFIQIDNTIIEKINMNTATLEQLKKHIYISDALANEIIAYRNHTGRFTTISEIQKVKGMYTKLYEKLKPYLTV
ncbi:MAG: helix-hairpin-helix domain-containing protein [Chitinophagales bacterium]|nr:helix-hairpin-helix domain-containing protein [Chitinophagales bacterium]